MECSLCTETSPWPGVACPQCAHSVCLACEVQLGTLSCPFCRAVLPPPSTRRWTSLPHFLTYCRLFQERERVRWDRYAHAALLFDRYTDRVPGAAYALRDALLDEDTDDELLENLFWLARAYLYDVAYYDKDMDQIENLLSVLSFLQHRQPQLLKHPLNLDEVEELYWTAEYETSVVTWQPSAPPRRTPPQPVRSGCGAQWYTRTHRYQQC